MKRNDNELYEHIMSYKKEIGSKRFFFVRLLEKYELIESAFEKGNKELLTERVLKLNDWLKSAKERYGITAPELKQYFSVNKMSMNFNI